MPAAHAYHEGATRLREFVTLTRRTEPLPEAVRERALAQHELDGSIFRARHVRRWIVHGGHTLVVTRYIAGPPVLSDVFFDGLGVHAGRAIRDERDIPPIDPVRFAAEARGPFLLVTVASGQVRILSDPLSVYPVWYWDDGETFIASNSTHLVRSALAILGVSVDKDPIFSAWHQIFASGVADSSPYRGVRWLPFGHHVALEGRSGHVAVRMDQLHTATDDELYRPSAPTDDLLERARSEIEENVAALSKADFRALVADLTGGFDSRVMLAAILSAGVEDRYAFHTAGGPQTADVIVAAALRERFGLAQAQLAPRPRNPTPDHLTSLRQVLFRSYGCSMVNVAIGIGLRSDRSVLHLNGACGETFRGMYTSQIRPPLTPRDLFKRQIRARGGLLADVVADELTGVIDARFELKRVRGFHDEDVVGDHHYIEQRNRQFMGPQVRARLNHCSATYPLYSPAAISAALTLPSALRGGNHVGFRLTEMMQPALLAHPFAEATWAPEVIAHHPRRLELEALRPVQPMDPPLASGEAPERVVTVEQRTHSVETGAHGTPTEWQRSMLAQGRHWSWARLDTSLDVLKRLVAGDAIDAVRDLFDADRLRALATRDLASFAHTDDVWLVHRTVGAVLWHTDQEAVALLES